MESGRSALWQQAVLLKMGPCRLVENSGSGYIGTLILFILLMTSVFARAIRARQRVWRQAIASMHLGISGWGV